MPSLFRLLSVCAFVLLVSACARTTEQPTHTPVSDMPTPPMEVQQTVIKVGVLLPLSGQASELGAAMLDGILLALGDVQKNQPANSAVQVIVLPKDTQGTVQGAIEATNDVIANGAHIILGPLYGQSFSAIAPILNQAGIKALSFSNNQLAAAPGRYVLGFQPQDQMLRVLEYARRRGIETVAALLPNDAYGRSIKNGIDRSGINVWRTAYYPSGAAKVDLELKQLFPNAGKGIQNERLTNGIGFEGRYQAQALIMPEGGPALQRLSKAFVEAQLEPEELVIIGSGQWEDDKVGVPSVLYGSWFAGVEPQRRDMFIKHFKANYGYVPPRLTSLAYDAAAMIVTMAFKSGDPQRAFSRSSLEKSGGFIGPADGLFRLLPNGLSERGLAVLQMTNKGPAVLEAAPERF